MRGRPPSRRGTIDAPIGRDRNDVGRMAVGGRAERPAVTHFELAEPLVGASLLRLKLETGRTHQIRVHLAAIGHPVLGDPLYGVPGGQIGLRRQFLHAARLAFAHPDRRPPHRADERAAARPGRGARAARRERRADGDDRAAERTEIAVIGAGVMGTSVAYHLALRGARVLLLDKLGAAGGPSGASAGMLRAHYEDPAIVAVARYGCEFLADMLERTGSDPGFVNCGYLAVGEADREPRIRRAIEAMRAQGVVVEQLDNAQIRALEPRLAAGALTIGAFEPTNGVCEPLFVADGFARAAERHGRAALLRDARDRGAARRRGLPRCSARTAGASPPTAWPSAAAASARA